METELPFIGQRWSRRRQRKSLNYSLNMLRSSQPIETVDLTVKAKRPNEENHAPSTSSRKNETPMKRIKKDELSGQLRTSRRSQPHRAARYTESYSNIAGIDASLPSDEENPQNGNQSDSESSDSDIEIIPNSPPKPLSEEQQLDWENRAQLLQQQLHNEEIKLVLLRKLKESQSKKEEKKEETTFAIPPHVKLSHKVSPRPHLQITNISASQSPTKKLIPVNKCVQQVQPQDLTKSIKSGQGATPNNLVALHSENLSKSNISILPVSSKSAANSQRPPFPVKNEVSISLVAPPKGPSAQQVKIEKEVSSQQQAMAKMALRKQLEKTLLQIPTPRPKVPKLKFLPNGNSPEFIWLLGLDIIVDFITKTKPMNSVRKEPYSCSQCKTNFSELWNTVKDSGNKRSVICQTCFSSNAKKSLKVEHTGHLKAAFVKALQQEKEIERMTHTLSVSSPMPSNLVSSVSQPIYSQPVCSKAMSSSRTTATTGSPNMFLGNNSLFMQQFGKLTPQQVQALFQAQAQSFMSANIPLPAHMVPFSPFIAQYPFHLMNKTGSSPNEMQRQYLLDMIPPSASSCAPVKRKR